MMMMMIIIIIYFKYKFNVREGVLFFGNFSQNTLSYKLLQKVKAEKMAHFFDLSSDHCPMGHFSCTMIGLALIVRLFVLWILVGSWLLEFIFDMLIRLCTWITTQCGDLQRISLPLLNT